jgi:hypothetical protein
MQEGEETLAKWKKTAYVAYQCSYHLVWILKCPYRILQGDIKEYVKKNQNYLRMEDYGNIFNDDNARLFPYAGDNISKVMGILKVKAAIAVFQQAN